MNRFLSSLFTRGAPRRVIPKYVDVRSCTWVVRDQYRLVPIWCGDLTSDLPISRKNGGKA
jgi:hypothetical protein